MNSIMYVIVGFIVGLGAMVVISIYKFVFEILNRGCG